MPLLPWRSATKYINDWRPLVSRVLPLEGFLLNLEQKIAPGRREYLTQEEAYQRLKDVTNQDFGYDAIAWRGWIQGQEALKKGKS